MIDFDTGTGAINSLQSVYTETDTGPVNYKEASNEKLDTCSSVPVPVYLIVCDPVLHGNGDRYRLIRKIVRMKTKN
jgi:hypothetical protein